MYTLVWCMAALADARDDLWPNTQLGSFPPLSSEILPVPSAEEGALCCSFSVGQASLQGCTHPLHSWSIQWEGCSFFQRVHLDQDMEHQRGFTLQRHSSLHPCQLRSFLVSRLESIRQGNQAGHPVCAVSSPEVLSTLPSFFTFWFSDSCIIPFSFNKLA